MPVHRLSVAEAAGGARGGAERWVATPRTALLWSLSLWSRRAGQSCHRRRHLLHQKVVRHNSREFCCHILFALLFTFGLTVARSSYCNMELAAERMRWSRILLTWIETFDISLPWFYFHSCSVKLIWFQLLWFFSHWYFFPGKKNCAMYRKKTSFCVFCSSKFQIYWPLCIPVNVSAFVDSCSIIRS